MITKRWPALPKVAVPTALTPDLISSSRLVRADVTYRSNLSKAHSM